MLLVGSESRSMKVMKLFCCEGDKLTVHEQEVNDQEMSVEEEIRTPMNNL